MRTSLMLTSVFVCALTICSGVRAYAGADTTTTHNNGKISAYATFDIDRAYNQLMYAYSSYCDETQLKSWKCTFCNMNASTAGFKVDTIVSNPITRTFGYIGNVGNAVQVAFRGTVNDINWIEDFDYAHAQPYKDVPNAFVHKGFLDAYDAVKKSVRNSVLKLVASTNATQVWVTGHSLGAALATLAALDLTTDAQVAVPVSVYNYGSPRVGNSYFSDYFHQKISNVFRIVNRADIVPHLPRYEMNYRHVAQEVWWKTATTYKICDMSGEDQTCSDGVLLYSEKDHLDYLNINVEQGC